MGFSGVGGIASSWSEEPTAEVEASGDESDFIGKFDTDAIGVASGLFGNTDLSGLNADSLGQIKFNDANFNFSAVNTELGDESSALGSAGLSAKSVVSDKSSVSSAGSQSLAEPAAGAELAPSALIKPPATPPSDLAVDDETAVLASPKHTLVGDVTSGLGGVAGLLAGGYKLLESVAEAVSDFVVRPLFAEPEHDPITELEKPPVVLTREQEEDRVRIEAQAAPLGSEPGAALPQGAPNASDQTAEWTGWDASAPVSTGAAEPSKAAPPEGTVDVWNVTTHVDENGKTYYSATAEPAVAVAKAKPKADSLAGQSHNTAAEVAAESLAKDYSKADVFRSFGN